MYFSAILIEDLKEFARSNGADMRSLKKILPDFRSEKYITYEQTIQAITEVGRVLDDEYLGLHIGEQISLKVTAHVDDIMKSSQTLEESFLNAVEYSKLISDALECTLKKEENIYTVIFEENPNWKVLQSEATRQILDLTLLSCLQSLVSYTNKNYRPIKINFHTTRPKSLSEYYRLFNCSLKFNQTQTEIVFEKHIFDQHTKKIESGLLASLKEKVAHEIKNLNPEDRLIYSLKKVILNHKPHRIKVVDAAGELSLSARTLQRKLKELDTSFKMIESQLLIGLAKTYLLENQKTLDEISYLLGFSESSAFIRFFRSFTALTPGEFLRNKIYR